MPLFWLTCNQPKSNRFMKNTFLLLLVPLLLTSVQMNGQTQKTRTAADDRIAIKDLVDAYSHNADRRHAHEQAMLFTNDGVIEDYHEEPGANDKPDATIKG